MALDFDGIIQKAYEASEEYSAAQEHEKNILEQIINGATHKTHTYENWESVDDTIHRGTCSCGETMEEPHSWGDWVTTDEPTHTTVGKKTSTCTVCGATKTEDIVATGHSFGGWVKINDTTHRRTCSCGAIEEAAHTWGNWVQTTPATCTAAGVQTATCTACAASKTQSAPAATGHSFGGWVKINDTTHRRTCSCGAIEQAAHAWGNWVQTTPATCEAAGVQTATCTTCGGSKTQSAPAAIGHNWYATFIDQNINGNHTRTCRNCQQQITERHNAVWYIEPKSKICWGCGEIWFY